MLAHDRLELASMPTARVAVRAVDSAPMPCQPTARIGVDVLPVAQVEQLALERALGLRIGPRVTEIAPEDDDDRHQFTVARAGAVGELTTALIALASCSRALRREAGSEKAATGRHDP